MPVTPTYPGIYIEELPSSARTITAAATSITVFVGYAHPFRTKAENWGKAIRLFSFTDYEREFGGLYSSGVFDSNVAHAVNQFFINGGSDAYVVALRPKYRNAVGTVIGSDPITGPSAQIGGIDFTALEPTDQIPMTVTITPPLGGPNTAADISIAYGSRVETYRGVNLTANDPNHIATRINRQSNLVTVGPTFPGTFSAITTQAIPGTTPAGFATTFSAADFIPVFQQDSDLDKVPIFNLLLLPGIADNGIWSAALTFCERKQAFLIMDPPRQDSADGAGVGLPKIEDTMDGPTVPKSPNGAIYFPYLLTQDSLTGNTVELPPSGYVAGIYARTDLRRGVWKAPAGIETTVLNTTGVTERGRMTDMRQGTLNPKGVNCLRSFPVIGTVVFGARTLVAANTALQQWRYVPVRRMALSIEQTLYRNLTWVVFEPNDEPLWVAIRTSIENYMLSLFQQGAFQGRTPSQAFQVKCDSTTTTQTDIDNGIVNIIVAFRPLKPAEFVIIKIAQLAGQVQA
jgi:phage tail sheath protein FI